MKIFVSSFDNIAYHFDNQQDDEGIELRNSSDTWNESRFSVEGAEVCDATPHQTFQYFFRAPRNINNWPALGLHKKCLSASWILIVGTSAIRFGWQIGSYLIRFRQWLET